MPNLTEEQIEKCCRALCQFRGVNADGENRIASSQDVIYNWEYYREEIISRYKALQADKAIIQTLS